MTTNIWTAFLVLSLAQGMAFANSYLPCDESGDSSLCVSSEYDDVNKIVWSGLSSEEKKHFGFLRLSNGDVFIGDMENTTTRGGKLLDISERSSYKVSVVDSRFQRLDAGEILTEKADCIYYPDSLVPCFDLLDIENTGGNFDYYVGELVGRKPNGFGYYFFDGGYYFGNFEDNRFSGVGTYISFSGAKYEGEFSRDAFAGRGVLTMVNGASFEGYFKNDQKHGMGKLVRPSGEIVFGLWKDDKVSRSLTFENQEDFAAYRSSEKLAIVRLQELLKANFYLTGRVDGILGPSTRKSLSDAVADSGSSPSFSNEILDLNASTAVESVSSLFLQAQGACESLGNAWSSCFVVRK